MCLESFLTHDHYLQKALPWPLKAATVSGVYPGAAAVQNKRNPHEDISLTLPGGASEEGKVHLPAPSPRRGFLKEKSLYTTLYAMPRGQHAAGKTTLKRVPLLHHKALFREQMLAM